jgi:glycosyltransferase involved in cell wall biosynthesis
LISVGVEWERKGISRVIELAAALNERGVPADLTVVGCSPPEPRKLPPWVTVTGMIDKDAEGGERRLGDLFARSHFHVLLSSAECFGLAFCEANAWGVPNLAADVGGIPTAVRHGKGGWRFDGAQSIASMADFVAKQFGDHSGYLKAAERARDEYETRLNWQVAGKTAMDHVRSMFDFEQLPKRPKN